MPGKGVEPPYDWFLDSATPWASGLAARLDPVRGLRVEGGIPLKAHTRFAVGSPADLFAWAETPQALGIGYLRTLLPACGQEQCRRVRSKLLGLGGALRCARLGVSRRSDRGRGGGTLQAL